MPFAVATLDGSAVFGVITRSTATPKPPARQRSSFFGTDGELDVYGGARGWNIVIEGVFQENDIPTVQADFTAIYNYAGAGTHTYTDTKGNTFNNVVFSGNLTPDPNGPHPTDQGWCQAYTLQMESLL